MGTEMLERRFAAIRAPVRPKAALRRRNRAYLRQGGWVFVPAPEIDPPLRLVLFDEPLSRGRGKAHVMQFAYRRGGPDFVYAKGAIRHPDHPTLVLWGWHRVALNAQQAIGG